MDSERDMKCLRCDHTWMKRKLTERVRVCPGCRSPYFDSPRKVKEQQEKEIVEIIHEYVEPFN